MGVDNLVTLGSDGLERRGWVQRFGIVQLHALGLSLQELLAEILVATRLLKPNGILIIEGWATSAAMAEPVPGLYAQQREDTTGEDIQLSLRASLDHILVPIFQTWRQLL